MRRFILIFLPAFWLAAEPAWAVNRTWTGAAGDNDWGNANNWNPNGVPATADNVTIDVAASVTAAAPTTVTFASLTLGDAAGGANVTLTLSTPIVNGGSLTVNPICTLAFQTTAQSTLTGDMTMVSGSTLTHTANSSPPLTADINLSVGGNFAVQAGATISVVGMGYQGGGAGSAGSGPGGGGSVFGQPGSGGGHGGQGGGAGPGAIYDSLTNPTDAGSGGGAALVAGAQGGAGGGFLTLSVPNGTLTVNGLIDANGGVGRKSGGGGSGGTISLSAATLAGSGTVRADGGAGAAAPGGTGAGGGGGGRLYVGASANNFTGTAMADGGAGGAGTTNGPPGQIGTIVSSATLTDHALGQTGNAFGTLGTSTRTLYRFELITSSGGVQLNSATFTLTSVSALFASNFAGTSLYLDANNNGVADPGELAVAGGTVSIVGANGTIAFSQPFAVAGSSVVAYILVSTVALNGSNQMTVSLSSSNMAPMNPAGFAQEGIRLGTSTAVTHTAPVGNPPPGNPTVSSVFVGSITVTYGTVGGSNGYEIDASTASDFSGALFSSATTNVNLGALSPQGLAINTTYFLRAGAIYGGTTNYTAVTPASTSTLAISPSIVIPSFLGVFTSSFTVQWGSGTVAAGYDPAGTLYQAEASQQANFATLSASSQTTALSAALTGLTSGAVYFARVKALNNNGVPSGYTTLGSTVTLANAPSNLTFPSVSSRTIALSWSANGNGSGVLYEVSQSTDGFNLNVTTPVPFAANLTATTTTIFTLTPNTTYSYRLRAEDSGGHISGFSAVAATVTLVASPVPLAFSNINNSAFTANWNPLDNPVDTRYAVDISTLVDFSLIQQTSSTFNSFATFSGLASSTIFYARLRAFNRLGIPTGYVLLGAVETVTGVVTLSADQLANVFTNKSSFTFSAQGAGAGGHYHWSFVPSANCAGDPNGPRFDGSAMLVPAPNPPADGDWYFCVLGHNSSEVQVGTSTFGPIRIDRTAPVIASVSAQRSATDATPIFSGQVSFAATPRFTWAAPASFAPIVGYDFAVNNGGCSALPFTITTTLNFSDQTFTLPGSYCVQTAALDQAGNWGPAASFTYVYTNVPAQTQALLKNNYFNPGNGERMTVTVQASQAGRVKVAIHSLRGALVNVLADASLPPGSYDFKWDGRNAAGQNVANGAYFVHVEAPGSTPVNLMSIVVK